MGAFIRIDEIPNAPGVGPAPPTAPYGKVPGAQFANQPTSFTAVKPLQNVANFEQYARDLQQAPLPEGFAQGQAMVASAAGRWAESAGKGTAQAAQSISNSLNAIGSVMTDAANKANASKDSIDKLRYNEFESIAKDQFESQMMKDKVPVEQWPERWKTEGAPRFMETVQQYGTTPRTRAEIQARALGYTQKQEWGYTLNVQKKTLQDGFDYLKASAEQGATEKDAAKMRTAYTEMAAQHYISEDMLKIKLAEADRVEHTATIDFVKQRNPKELRDQAVLAREGKATGAFEFLNKDPALAAQTAHESAQELNIRQSEKITEFSNKILSRDKRMTDEQIESEGRAAGLDETDIAKLKKQNVLEVPWNDQAVAEANTAVATYDPKDDIDPNTKLPSVKRYKEIVDQINTTVPKEFRQPLLTELNKSVRDARSGEKKNPMEKRRGDYYQDIDRLAKSELLGPTGLDKDGTVKKDQKSVAAHAELFKKVTTLQNGVDALLEKAQAEKWDMTKFDEEYRKLLVPQMTKEAGAAIHKKGAPELPPVSSAEEKAREAPVPKMVGSGYVTQELPKTPQNMPSGPTVTGPRTLRETPEFTAAWAKVAPSGQAMTVTAYVPGMGGIEGGPGVASRKGKANTMEDYMAGQASHVSVAMDEKSEWQGKYLISPSYPGVIFKVEDTGGAFKGKGETAIDIAFKDPSKATNYKEDATFAPVERMTLEELAAQVEADKARDTGEAPGVPTQSAQLKNVNPSLTSKLDVLQQKFGALNITSGYRSPEHNLAVGGARGSQHTHGNAVDISVKGMSTTERLALIDAATRAGITGIGVYTNALHFDVGPRRAWGPSYGRESVPAWAQGAISRHLGYG